jgi:hypothetical protein
MWYLLQCLIIFGVSASNVYWEWTPNKYLAGALGVGAAFLVTQIVNDLVAGARKKRGAGPGQERV